MGVLRKIFGPSQTEVWKELCSEIGAEFVKGRFWKGNKVQAHIGKWTVTLDAYTVSTGSSFMAFTRLRAPYVSIDGFRFAIYRNSLFSSLKRYWGMKHIETGDPKFDRYFVIKSNSETKAMALFSSEKVRHLIQAQPSIYMEVKDDEGWFGTNFPQGVDELCFRVPGIIKDVERLKTLYRFFGEVLNHLCRIGSACENDPHITL